MAISGVGLGMTATGAFLAYAGITNQPLADALRAALKGNVKPASNTPPAWATTSGTFTGDPSQTTVSSPYVAAGGDLLGVSALKYVGRRYAWGKNFDSPDGGGDCSGLVFRSFHDLGYMTPRLTANMYPTWGAVRRDSTALPGDILWWPGHVAIVVGQGNMIEAPTFGIPVRVVPVRRGYLALTPQFNALQKYAYHVPDRGPI